MATTPTNAPQPAYASAPRRSGLLYAIAGLVGLAALAAIALVLFGGGRAPAPGPTGAAPAAGVADAQKSLEAAKAALDQASKNVLQPPASSLPAPAPGGDAAGQAAAPAQDTAPRAEPPAVAPPPPRVAATTEAPKPALRPAPSAPPPPKAPTAAPPPAPATAAQPAPAAAPPAQVASAERWTQMRDEMARCSSTSLIPRIQCEQRIRARYCDGYWGSVPECATSSRKG